MENVSLDNVKAELKSYIHNKQLLEEIDDEINEYREKATSCTSVLSDMPKGSGTPDKLAKYACMIVDLENEKYESMILLEKSKKEIEDVINQIEQPYRNILYFKYIKGYSLTVVASKIRYNYKHTCRLHGTALKKYKNIKYADKNG